jgi:phosphatidate cytidylyltransferase
VVDEPTSAAGAPAPTTSRAGRNLPVAIATGVVLAATVLVSLFTFKPLFAVVAVVAVLVGVSELVRAFAGVGTALARMPLYLGTVGCTVAAYLGGPVWLMGAFGATVLFTLFWRLRRGTQGFVRDTAASLLVAAYLPLMIGFAMLTAATSNGAQRIVVFIVLTVGSDIGGYIAGVLFGKHPMAPQISPKKSWEGFAGSALLQAALGVWLFVWLFGAPWWQGLVAGLVLTVTATAGDLVESAIKRDLGIKDLGTIVPGHGGIMDRLDSLVPNAFTSWLLFTIFLGQ